MNEFYVKFNEKEWIKQIKELKKYKEKINKEKLKNKIILAVKERIPDTKFGILFSGGVDSSLIALICKKFTKNFICYSVGVESGNFRKSPDLESSSKVAFKLKFKLKKIIVKDAEKIIKKTVKIIGTDVVKVGVGAVIVAAMEQAKKDGVKVLFSGLGSEEIFAGYERHKVKDVNDECWKGLTNMWERDLVRDIAIAKKYKISLKTPFLDKELIKYAMQIPGNKKLNKKGNKMILREIAFELGLGEFAFRKKLAAQYGSNFDKIMGKLARKKGFKLKKDYLKNI